MKKKLLSSTVLLVLLVMLQSCYKEIEQPEIIKKITIDTTISAGTHYYLNLAPFGKDDDVATIVEKGNIFSISQLQNINEVFTTIYHYSTAPKTTGIDHIVLSITQNPEESQMCSRDSTIIYINITIK